MRHLAPLLALFFAAGAAFAQAPSAQGPCLAMDEFNLYVPNRPGEPFTTPPYVALAASGNLRRVARRSRPLRRELALSDEQSACLEALTGARMTAIRAGSSYRFKLQAAAGTLLIFHVADLVGGEAIVPIQVERPPRTMPAPPRPKKSTKTASAPLTAHAKDLNADLLKGAEEGKTDVVQALIAKGVNLNVRTNKGWTALMGAAVGGHTDTVKALLEAGADVNAKGKIGVTALMLAARGGHTETVQALLEAGADVNGKYQWGVVALMLAARGGHTETAQALLEAGADVNAKIVEGWRKGRTALMMAARGGHTDIVQLLKQAGAKE